MCILCGPEPAQRVIDHSIDHPFELKPDSDNDCLTCGEHLALHPDKYEYFRKAEMDTIIKHGHQVRAIFDPEGEDPAFAYTIGRCVKDRPELLLTGNLHPHIATAVLNDAAAADDKSPLEVGQLRDEIIQGYPVKIGAVRNLEEAGMFGVSRNFGEDTPALQIIWPDDEGRFPGDKGYKYGDDAQPVYA